MTFETLLDELDRRGISLAVECCRVRYRAPEGAMTPELLQALVRHKPEVIRLLAKPPAIGPNGRPIVAVRIWSHVLETSLWVACTDAGGPTDDEVCPHVVKLLIYESPERLRWVSVKKPKGTPPSNFSEKVPSMQD